MPKKGKIITNEEGRRICDGCNKDFSSIQSLSRHKKLYCTKTPTSAAAMYPEGINKSEANTANVENISNLSDYNGAQDMNCIGNQIRDSIHSSNNIQINIQQNIQQTNNIQIFNAKYIDLYKIKENKYGRDASLENLYKIASGSNPNTKLGWMTDTDAIESLEDIGVIYNRPTIIINTVDKGVIYDNGKYLNNMCNEIITNSILAGLNDKILDAVNSKADDSIKYNSLYDGPYGRDIIGNLIKYRAIIPTKKHIDDVLSQIPARSLMQKEPSKTIKN